jgi:DNA-binding beta-propeller fold protein YncE
VIKLSAPHVRITGLAVDPATNVIYAANLTSTPGGGRGGAMAVIIGATNHITATMPLDGPLVSLAVNPATDTVYVVHLKGITQRGFSVINGRTNTETANVMLGPYAWGIAI